MNARREILARRTRAAMTGKAGEYRRSRTLCGGEQTHNPAEVVKASVLRALSMSFEVYASCNCEHVPGWLVLLPVT